MRTLTDTEFDEFHVSVRDVIRLLEDALRERDAELSELRALCSEQQALLREQHALLREACGEAYERDRAPALH